RAAAEIAVSSPLLEASIDGAHGVLLSIAGGSDLGLFEVSAAANLIQGAAHDDANIIFGTVIDDALGDEVRVTVIAAGFEGGQPPRRQPGISRSTDLRSSAAPRPAAVPEPTPAPSVPEPAANGNGHGNGQPHPAPPVVTPAPSVAPVAPVRPMPVSVPSRPLDDDLDVPDFLK
ncbi:MAG TPA: cell division protein FtsZ, partial [Propionibacteriaceae bacterium]|nr:cell division protein FtsZ [Propionibacteriaceae bacterium]